jgi:GT2 family glycosyltransferase
LIKYVGIIVPVKDQLFFTKQFLESCEKLEFDQNLLNKDIIIIVVDNGSSKETTDFLSEWSLTDKRRYYHKLITNEENLGFSKAVNQGLAFLKQVGGGDAVITNNDVEFTPSCLTELYNAAYLYGKKNVGIVGAKLLFPDDTVQHAGAFLNVYGWGQHKLAGEKSTNLIFSIGDYITEEEYVTGALMFLSSAAIQTIEKEEGMVFDERFFMFFEEVDLCYRLRKYGYKTVLNTKAVAYHYEGRS